MRQPLIIYVSGAPGAGKSTLARLLSQQLYIPYVASDLVHGGVRMTGEGVNDRKKTLMAVFVPLLIQMAQTNVSFLVDHVLQKDKSEADIIDKLRPYAKLVYIHVHASNAVDRFYERERKRSDRGIALNPDELRTRRDYHKSNLANTEDPLDLDVPHLEVATDDGYEPNIAFILDFIEHEYSKEKKV